MLELNAIWAGSASAQQPLQEPPVFASQNGSLRVLAANFLVNRRMNKSQQARWSRRRADLLLRVRCVVYNGTLGSGFGQKCQAANDPYPLMRTSSPVR